MKTTSSSGILKTVYHNGRYLLLFGKKNYKVLKYLRNDSSYFKTGNPSFKGCLQITAARGAY